jgi:hypothetical protein
VISAKVSLLLWVFTETNMETLSLSNGERERERENGYLYFQNNAVRENIALHYLHYIVTECALLNDILLVENSSVFDSSSVPQ